MLVIRAMRAPIRLPDSVDKNSAQEVLEFATRSSYPTAHDPLLAVAHVAAQIITAMHDELHEIADQVKMLGPICPFDGKPALLHFAGLPTYTMQPRSFKEPLPLVKHPYFDCWDCDDLSSYHHDGIPHCERCGEGPDTCDGTPLIGGNVPSHDAWPEGCAWWEQILSMTTDKPA